MLVAEGAASDCDVNDVGEVTAIAIGNGKHVAFVNGIKTRCFSWLLKRTTKKTTNRVVEAEDGNESLTRASHT